MITANNNNNNIIIIVSFKVINQALAHRVLRRHVNMVGVNMVLA